VTPPLFAARGLRKRFGGVAALQDVEVVQHRHETLGMIGPNGSGKTSFVNSVTGDLRLDGGTVEFDGRPITGLSGHRVAAAGLTRTYQAVRVFSRLSVAANLETARTLRDTTGGAFPAHAEERELLAWLRLDHRLGVEAGGLTLFEQRRLELAMRLVLRPSLILLDEPVGGLAPSEVRGMMQLLDELRSRCTLFVIEHTMKVIRELADRVVVLVAGQKLADGPPAEILRDRRVIEHYLGVPPA
jgi:ABC-type branched-subunit amino acid transport system ATPase component